MTAIPQIAVPRRLLLSDVVVLIGVTAIALGIFRMYHAELNPLKWWPPGRYASTYRDYVGFVWSCLILASPFAMAWTLAILGLRLRHPRPRWGRVVRQPGLIAGLIAASVLAVRLLGFAIMFARIKVVPNNGAWRALLIHNAFKSLGEPGPLIFGADHFLGTMAMIGLSVGSGWMLLLISGRWRPERSWIDRAGRVLGWFWIATLPLTCWFDFNVFL